MVKKTLKKQSRYKKSKKIILVSNSSWYLYNFRFPLLKLLEEKGFSIELVAPYDSYTKKIEKAGYKVNYWVLNRRSINPIKELKSLLDLIYLFKRIKPNLVHNFTIKACLYSTIATKFSNINIVVNSITGLGQIFIGGKPLHLLLRFFLRPFYKFVFKRNNSIVIFQNKSDQEKLISLGITDIRKTKIIKGSGVDIHLFKPSNLKNKNYLIPKILFPSRLIYEKGIKELLVACDLLWNKNINFKLIIAGGIEFANSSYINKTDFLKIKKHKNISLLGHVSNMHKLYESAYLVVLPSWREGLSRTLIESAAMEKPIITTNVSGCRDVIDHGINGILVPKKDPKSLSLAIELLLKNPKFAKKLGLSARKKVINEFQVKHINNQTINTYKELLFER